MEESCQHCKSWENKVFYNQVIAILQFKFYTVVDDVLPEKDCKATYTGECMNGIIHGRGTVKFSNGDEFEVIGYHCSKLCMYLF